MKIAQVCPRFYPHIGGVETHVYEIASRIAKKFDVEVLTTDPGGKLPKVEEIDGLTVRRFKSLAPSEAYYFSPELYDYLKKNSSDYDVVHAHNYHAFPALFAALTKGKNKLIFTPHYHGSGHSFFRNVLHKPYKIFGRKIFKRADAIVCVSNYEKNLVLKNFKVAEDRTYVIPNGINLDEFKDIEKIKRNKESWKKTILYVGRVEKYKGLDYVVKSLKHLPDNFTLEVVGKGSYKSKIVEMAKKLDVIDRIRFYQDLSRKELIDRYAKADVLVLLSKHEAYGIVVAEALAAKTPCIVANTSALSEWIDNKNVFGIDYPINVSELARLIERVSNVKAGDMKLLDWDDVNERLIRIYSAKI
ncbi:MULTISPECIES: glycosyltransferase family 4 protein [Archaeoglobus]|uniref:LPS biosynthesis protein, putative n=3 Tax=Archaeoglobus fulgidus TaxID=2234 RepID=O29638_ARCFU|nr:MULTISPECIES: glycosyltransferase family 4 protein [Archaeoglobus]AAB90623.1 LPS biosynthesis protein, putative [Archaeoglobus fulgidus DSM 4304]AIG97497.1 Glycosyltransferase [Archaeoglobus fulgidus DSM 8774]KUK07050.1 MAG: LPS biosynthesis protein, putative [Archaeoglobus fulgidus]MDI3497069.1 hypothetical protein [Archaeoglobus sp.]